MTQSGNHHFREEEIRPDHLKAAQLERIQADIDRLVSQKDRFVHVACPACGTDGSSPAMEKHRLIYVTCAECQTMYVNPRPTPEILEDFYANSENYWYWNKYIFPASESSRREKIFLPRAQRLADICKNYGVENDALVDIGAGFGTFCEEVLRMGSFKRVIAVEPTPDLAETCRQKGLEVIELPVEKVDLGGYTISVISAFEVIEHLHSPREFIMHCARLLVPGGLLILSCPNVRGFDVVVLGEKSDTIDWEHLNYFHPSSLARLVSDLGLDVLEVSTPGRLDVELVRKKIVSRELDVTDQPWLRWLLVEQTEEIRNAFQEFLARNELSSHMWLVARKPGIAKSAV